MRFTARLSIAVVTMWFLSGYPFDPGAREAAAADDHHLSDVSDGATALARQAEVATTTAEARSKPWLGSVHQERWRGRPREARKALLGSPDLGDVQASLADELETLAKRSRPRRR